MQFFIKILFIVSFIGNCFSQQLPISSHINLNKQLINPAFSGNQNNADFQTSFRAQWVGFNGSPATFFIGGQTPMMDGKFGLGGYFYNDFAGNSITHTGIILPLSYTKKLKEESAISFGLAPIIEQYSMDLTNQNALISNDPALFQSQAITYLADLNLGFSYKKDSIFTIGIGVQQLLESKINIAPLLAIDSNRFKRHFNLYASYLLFTKNKFSITPIVIGKSIFVSPFQFDLGTIFTIDKFSLGCFYRSSDALYAQIGINLNSLYLYYSYDMTLSKIRTFSTGSHEITLKYKIKTKLDSDKDGIPDVKDKCKDEPGPKENLGCPWGDKDNDGITDNFDKCPDVPGVKENNGCPWGDKDNDGITDNFDKCPDTPGTKENNGCPWLDTDNDGVTDNIDQCPNTKGSIENKGCPIVNEDIKKQISKAVDNLEFETNSDKIINNSLPALDVLSILLFEKSDWNIRLSGHTDNVGDDNFNLELSRRRAEAIKIYLISKGINAERISIEYFGESLPIDTNDTQEGRKQNRRVEITLIFN